MPDILFLAHRIPYPPNRGDKIRSWHMLKHLGALGRVHLACFADDAADAAHLPALREAMGGSLGQAHVELRTVSKPTAAARAMIEGKPISLTLFDSVKLRAFVDRILAEQDIGTIFVFSGQMAQFVPQGRRFVMDFVDMDSAKFAEYAETGPAAMRLVNRREAERLFAFERATAARADASLFVSEAEAALFKSRTGLPNIRAISNGIDFEHFDPAARVAKAERGEGPLLLFTGQMDYRPNVEAVEYFAREVLPLVPGARFAIAGRNPSEAVLRLKSDCVLVTGEVADIRSWLAVADVVVAPLRIARGIQNKVLEAMAMARPVVASPAAFEGIEAEAGRDLLVAGLAEAQAEAIRGLLASPEKAASMGAAARRLVEERYSWASRLAPLGDILRPAAQEAA